MVHLGLSSRAGSRLRSGLRKIEFYYPKEADEMNLLGEAGLLPWVGRRVLLPGTTWCPSIVPVLGNSRVGSSAS